MKQESDKILILLPAHNEADNISKVIGEAKKFGRVLVADDGSDDGTVSIAKKSGAEVLALPLHKGKGNVIYSGIHFAVDNFDFDALVLMDADGQHSPGDIPKLIETWKINRCDLVLGVRSLSPKSMPLPRVIWNRIANAVILFFTERVFKDSQCGFRLISKAALERMVIKRKSYSVDSEIIFWAIKNNLNFKEVGIETIWRQQPADFLKDLRRAAYIFSYLVIGGFKTSLIYSWPPAKRVLFNQKLISSAVLFLVLSATLYQGYKNLNTGTGDFNSSLSGEMKTALEWLKNNSDEDAIVMAHWFRGHQIVAFADKRVISTTKVYPSESKEVAARYKDIAKFFLTDSEDEALTLAKKYQASYVFLDKSFQWWICLPVNRCDLFPGRTNLAPWARSTTMVGLMVRGADFSHFQKVWDSPRFVIYKISDKDERSMKEVRFAAIHIVRKTMEELLGNKKLTAADFIPMLESKNLLDVFLKPQGAALMIWNNQKLRASLTIGGSLLENLINNAVGAMSDSRFPRLGNEELESLRIEIALVKNDLLKVDPYLLQNIGLNPLKGYVIEYLGKKIYFLPYLLNLHQYSSFKDSLSWLCTVNNLKNDCFKSREATVYMFGVDDFIESFDKKNVFSLHGPFLVRGETFDKNRLLQRMIKAADWVVKNQNNDGSYVFKVNAQTGNVTQNLNLIRNSLTAQSLTNLYQFSGKREYVSSALKNREYVEATSTVAAAVAPSTLFPTGSLAFRIFNDLALFNLTKDEAYLDNAGVLAEKLWGLKKENSSFWPWFVADGRPDEGTKGSSNLADYHVLAALGAYENAANDRRKTEELRAAAEIKKDEFRKNRILKENSLSLGLQGWLLNIFKEIYNLGGEKDDADFVFEIGDWLVDQQWPGNDWRYGSFPDVPDGRTFSLRGTSKVLEALDDAFLIAQERGDKYHTDKYKKAIELAFLWIFNMQFDRENSYWVNSAVGNKAEGGFIHTLLDQEMWMDSASHFILAGTNYILNQLGN